MPASTTWLSPLYPILDSAFLPPAGASRQRRMQSLVEELLAVGVTILQYRNKSGIESEVLADARILRSTAPPQRCLLILNDSPMLAVQAGFDGVHLGQRDMGPEQAREILGRDRMLGLSTHSVEQLAAADCSSADYLAIGPVFTTKSKENPDPVVGIVGVSRARAATEKPLVAIGGITAQNCRLVRDAGADSVAVISSLLADPTAGAAGKIASDFFFNLR